VEEDEKTLVPTTSSEAVVMKSRTIDRVARTLILEKRAMVTMKSLASLNVLGKSALFMTFDPFDLSGTRNRTKRNAYPPQLARALAFSNTVIRSRYPISTFTNLLAEKASTSRLHHESR
jgi:hypothetical protein